MSISIASVGFWYQNPYKNWGAFLTDGAPRGVFLFDPISAPPFFRRCPRKRGNYFFWFETKYFCRLSFVCLRLQARMSQSRGTEYFCLLFAPAPEGGFVQRPFTVGGKIAAFSFWQLCFCRGGGRTVFKIMKTWGLLQALCAGICRLRQKRFFAFWKKNICARRSYCCAIE